MAPALVHIEAVQTAVPTRVHEPAGQTRPVGVVAAALPAAALRRRARVVLYYRADGAPWEEAVWVKESLSEALADHPLMAGRLRRRADAVSWEVKLNDTGVRLVLATAEAAVDDFVGASGQDRARMEAALAPWTDVNADDPDMCSLCFVQLTRFQGDGGYAVGVSCSLMLCDPAALARFLLSWARTHTAMKAKNEVAANPMMQYASYFQRPGTMTRRVRSTPLDTFTAAGADVETVLFRAAAAAGETNNHRDLARACVDKASQKLGAAKVQRFSVVVVDHATKEEPQGRMTMEACTADADGAADAGLKLELVQWKELGLEDLVLRDSKPVHVSYSIVTGGDEGLVVLMPDGEGFLITATVPKQ